MLNNVKNFVSNNSGATAIEYALIASLIAVALVTILTSLGIRVRTIGRSRLSEAGVPQFLS